MTRQEWGFVLLLAANGICVLIYLLVNFLRNRRREGKIHSTFLRAFVMLLAPGIGPLFFGGGWLLGRLFYRSQVDLSDVIFSKERVQAEPYADEERERDTVPLGEALAVSDTDSLRRLMMSVVKGNVHDRLAAIAVALESADSETAHYAASVLQDELDAFRARAREGYARIVDKERRLEIDDGKSLHAVKEKPSGMDVGGSQGVSEGCDESLDATDTGRILDEMDAVLRQRVFTEVEQRQYVSMMEEMADAADRRCRGVMTSARIEALCLRLLEVGDYDNCRKWCFRAEYLYPDALATYTCELRLYYAMHDSRHFFRVMEALRQSEIEVDSETLERIRVFL